MDCFQLADIRTVDAEPVFTMPRRLGAGPYARVRHWRPRAALASLPWPNLLGRHRYKSDCIDIGHRRTLADGFRLNRHFVGARFELKRPQRIGFELIQAILYLLTKCFRPDRYEKRIVVEGLDVDGSKRMRPSTVTVAGLLHPSPPCTTSGYHH